MNEAKIKTYTDFILPPNVVSKRDLSRLLDEAQKIDNDLTTAMIRAKSNSPQGTMPGLSEIFETFLVQNQLTLKDSHQRSDLIVQLRKLKDSAPIIHMTFAVTADPESLQKLVMWLRTSIHPHAVITVGLQPALIAGVYLRTPNHVRDLSMRAKLDGSHGLIVKELEALRAGS